VLDRSTQLPNGMRVRLRLPHGTDRPGLRELHARAGVPIDDVGLTRLLRVDPRRRAAIVATAWVGGRETVAGFAVGDVYAEDPELVVADPAFGIALPRVLGQGLRRRSSRVA
jgi:hypothetical protein